MVPVERTGFGPVENSITDEMVLLSGYMYFSLLDLWYIENNMCYQDVADWGWVKCELDKLVTWIHWI